eukprot:1259864-Alexandrium_andersonii.AAC.1
MTGSKIKGRLNTSGPSSGCSNSNGAEISGPFTNLAPERGPIRELGSFGNRGADPFPGGLPCPGG